MAVQLFHACNDDSDILWAELFFFFYDLWRQCENGVHLGISFNMMVQKLAYINGSNKNQLEIVRIEDNDVDRVFGSKDTEAL